MGRTDAVNRNTDSTEPGGGGTRDALFGQVPPAGLQIAGIPAARTAATICSQSLRR